jgi:hypothetical protein
LDNVKRDILKNVGAFLADDSKVAQNIPVLALQKAENKEPWLNYRVNLFIDNSKLQGSPVVMDTNYSFANIFVYFFNHCYMLLYIIQKITSFSKKLH